MTSKLLTGSFDPHQLRPALALIRIPSNSSDPKTGPAAEDEFGSGFFISRSGLLLTAAHNLTEDGQPNGVLLQWVWVCCYRAASDDWDDIRQVIVDPDLIVRELDAALLRVPDVDVPTPLTIDKEWESGDSMAVLGFQPDSDRPSGFNLRWIICGLPSNWPVAPLTPTGETESSLRLGLVDVSQQPLGTGISGGPVVNCDHQKCPVVAVQKAVQCGFDLRPPEIKATPIRWLLPRLKTIEDATDVNWMHSRHRTRRRAVGTAACLLISIVLAAFWYGRREVPLPDADPKRFAVAVAHFGNDADGEYGRLLLETLHEQFDSASGGTVQVLSFDRHITRQGVDLGKAVREGHNRAREYLAASGADVLIWGDLITYRGSARARLYWTPSRELQLQTDWGRRYDPTDDLELPSVREDLVEVLRLLVVHEQVEFEKLEGDFLANRIRPFIEKVRNLATSAEKWDQEDRHAVQLVLARSLLSVADVNGGDASLDEVGQIYRRVLNESAPETAIWAAAQVGLGNTLTSLGGRKLDYELLKEAIDAFRHALTLYHPTSHPIEWVKTQVNLGNALAFLGAWRSAEINTEAIAAYRAAAQVLTAEASPVNWARLQNNLGNVLWLSCEPRAETSCLEEVRAAYSSALTVVQRNREPLYWAMSQSNLGNALQELGKRLPLASAIDALKQAEAAYMDALTEYTRERVPEDWAMSQLNLCGSFVVWGSRTQDVSRARAARDACDMALQVLNAAPPGLLWAATHENLGDALSLLGHFQRDPSLLEQAIDSYNKALSQYSRKELPLRWAMVQTGLANVLRTLGSIRNDAGSVCRALEMHIVALETAQGKGATYYTQQAQRGLNDDVLVLQGDLAARQGGRCLSRHASSLKRLQQPT